MQRGGEVVLERYGDDIDASTTLRSWSMAKSLLHAVVGMLVDEGRLELDAPAPVVAWGDPDPRHAITLRHLLEMRPGLEWSEIYLVDTPSDVVEMLFGIDLTPQPDVAAYAAAKPLVVEPGTVFNYSSGTSNIVSGLVRDVVGAGDAYRAFLRDRLFGPLGMTSAEPQFDAAGTWIASSYCFCTAREFASFGQLYLDGGVRDGVRLLTRSGWPTPRGRSASPTRADRTRCTGGRCSPPTSRARPTPPATRASTRSSSPRSTSWRYASARPPPTTTVRRSATSPRSSTPSADGAQLRKSRARTPHISVIIESDSTSMRSSSPWPIVPISSRLVRWLKRPKP